MFEHVEMRAVMADFLKNEMKRDKDLVVFDADLARACGTTEIHETFKDRAFNVGIAESNMACIAAGMASYGFKPVIYSFTPFVTRRICDQVAISICYAKQNVKIIGTDPGITAELNGGTHMSVEDVGVMRSIPNLVIFEPVDCDQLYKALPQILAYEGPLYMRLLRKTPKHAIFNAENYEFNLFKADVLREGNDITLFAAGIEVGEAIEAADALLRDGIHAEVISVHTIKPLDQETIINSARKTGCAISCENHNVVGGMGEAIAGLLMKECPVPMEMIGIQDHFGEVGKVSYLSEKFQMRAQDIYEAALRIIKTQLSHHA